MILWTFANAAAAVFTAELAGAASSPEAAGGGFGIVALTISGANALAAILTGYVALRSMTDRGRRATANRAYRRRRRRNPRHLGPARPTDSPPQ